MKLVQRWVEEVECDCGAGPGYEYGYGSDVAFSGSICSPVACICEDGHPGKWEWRYMAPSGRWVTGQSDTFASALCTQTERTVR